MSGQKPSGVIRILRRNGFEAYFAGGCARDALFGRENRDWDVATLAIPEQVCITAVLDGEKQIKRTC